MFRSGSRAAVKSVACPAERRDVLGSPDRRRLAHLVHPPAGHPVLASDLALRASFEPNLCNH